MWTFALKCLEKQTCYSQPNLSPSWECSNFSGRSFNHLIMPMTERSHRMSDEKCCVPETFTVEWVCLLNRTAHIRHQCRKTTVLSCHGCLINTGVEKNDQYSIIDKNFDHQMSLSKRKCWYPNSYLHFIKSSLPLINKNRKVTESFMLLKHRRLCYGLWTWHQVAIRTDREWKHNAAEWHQRIKCCQVQLTNEKINWKWRDGSFTSLGTILVAKYIINKTKKFMNLS